MKLEEKIMGLTPAAKVVGASSGSIYSWIEGPSPMNVVRLAEAGIRYAMYERAKLVADIGEFPDAVWLIEQHAPALRISDDYQELTFIEPTVRQFYGDDTEVENPDWTEAKRQLRFAYRGPEPKIVCDLYAKDRLAIELNTEGTEFIYDIVRLP